MARSKRPRGLPVGLLATSIVLSIGSLVCLVVRPAGTGSLRTSLEIVALLLVIATTLMLGRGSGGTGV